MIQKRKERIYRGIRVRSGDIFALTSYLEMLYVAIPTILPVIGFVSCSASRIAWWCLTLES